MKNLILNCLKVGILVSVILSSALALYIHHMGEGFDPVREIQRLRDGNRRDDALDMAMFFSDGRSGNQEEMERLAEDLEYTIWEKSRSFLWEGAIKGQVRDSYSGIGAISSDLCIVGDIRDLGVQSWKYLTDDPGYDNAVMLLSAAGVGLSSTAFANVANALAKSTVKYLKRIPSINRKGLLGKFLAGKVSKDESKKIWNLLKKTSGASPGPRTALATSPTQDNWIPSRI